MKHTRSRFQRGSLRRISRKNGPDVWEYRYRDHTAAGGPMRQFSLSTLQYKTESEAWARVQAHIMEMNGPKAYTAHTVPLFGTVIDRFLKEERIREILKQKPGIVTITDSIAYSTARGYWTYIIRYIEPRWMRTPVPEIRAMDVAEWITSLPLAPKTRGQVRAVMHLLFERAMFWGLMEINRNPIELVKIRGVSKRRKRPQILAPEQFRELIGLLHDPYRTMVVTAMCTGLRVSEVLALRWEDIDFESGTMMVRQGVVNGRIGKVKTEASQDEVPLDPEFSATLLAWRGERRTGLVFPSPRTGRAFHSGMIQRTFLRPKGESLGIPNLGWHTFRHTYRSLLDETGAPIGVQQKLMRHSNVSTTMNVYGNATTRAKQQANSKVVQMVLPQRAEASTIDDERIAV